MPWRQPISNLGWTLQATLGVFVLIQFLGFTMAVAQDASPRPDASQLAAELDGRRFVGTLKAKGDSVPDNDAFTFKDGKFMSEGCLKWGFSPAPYWTRRASDGLHFLSELSSPEHGTMRYEGIFDGKAIKGTAYWKKVRWYWTLERDYSFQGNPSGSRQ